MAAAAKKSQGRPVATLSAEEQIRMWALEFAVKRFHGPPSTINWEQVFKFADYSVKYVRR